MSRRAYALDRSFWKLFTASATTTCADGIGKVSLPLLAASLTSSPVLISGLTAFAFLPWLLFGLPGGALVDRVDRRRAMATVNVIRAVLLGLLVVVGVAHIWVLYAAAFALGGCQVVYDSAARAILPQIVDRRRLDAANSWLTVEETVGQNFVGPPVGAALFGWFRAAPFVGTSLGFALAAVLVTAVPGRYRAVRAEPTTVRADIAEGLRWLWRHPVLRGFTILSGLMAALLSMATALTVLYAVETLRLSPSMYGVLFIAMGIGGLAGSAAVGPVTARIGRPRAITAAAAVAPVMCVLLGTTTNTWSACACFFGIAVGITAWNVLSMSLRQAMIPTDLLGRVLATHRVALWGGIPLGALAGGTLAAHTSVPTTFLISGLAQLTTASLIHRLISRHRQLITESATP
ncbi:MFS transporter [Actinokineospora cianjurensis]|uniref:Putative MFS family arabinose efflux permease n=1 Tax=Actinokineospora cianjurensis TaxID=585224 RepID=A0A421BCD2_9PSEU|nr:MFS transporter [Actinokineospora cianjurensis]RLK61998.1 putative MFS family arabinose efflux permease [Actinokineospora cianjurensis]